jgi:hypothetical protein
VWEGENQEHTSSRHDLLEIVTPIIMKQLISLINDGEAVRSKRIVNMKAGKRNEPNTVEGQDVRLVHEVLETSRSSDENVTSLLELITLLTDRTTTIDDTWPQHRTVA